MKFIQARNEIEDVATNNANMSAAAQLEQQERMELYRIRMDAAMAEAFHNLMEKNTCLLLRSEKSDHSTKFSAIGSRDALDEFRAFQKTPFQIPQMWSEGFYPASAKGNVTLGESLSQ